MPQSFTIASKDTTNPGDLIHTDLNGPEPSFRYHKVWMDFVDETSRLLAIEFLEHKGQVPNALSQFIRKCRTT